MKKIITILISLLLTITTIAQVQNVRKISIENGTTQFGRNLPAYTEITDRATNTVYQITAGALSTATLDGTTSKLKLTNTGLEKITESTNTGWRLVDSDPENFGDIGSNAIDLSISTGASTTYGATGSNAVALGYHATASSSNAVAIFGTASGNNSTSVGLTSTATGLYSIAVGYGADATDSKAIAIGNNNQASGEAAVAIGAENTNATGVKSLSIGGSVNNSTTASGDYSVAISGGQASGIHSMAAAGYHPYSLGNASFAVGGGINTGGGYYAERTNKAGGHGSHSQGVWTRTGIFTGTGYSDTYVSGGYAAHAEGYGTIAQNQAQHSAGQFNIGTSTTTIHETGIGSGDGARANAFEIYTDGTITAPSATNLLINNRGGDALTTKNYVDAATSSLYQGLTWNSATDTYTRLGSLTGIATSQSAGSENLPIQSDMKRCLLADDGTVNYYIDATNPIMKDGTTVTTTGTTTATTAYKLVDSGADFVSSGIAAGQFAYNSTDDTYSIITAVDDLNTLSLERDIFITGELYDIGTANFGGADGQVMVEIPKFYHKHTLVSTTNSWYISKYDLPGYELHPAFWKDGKEVDYRYMSAFEGGMYDASTGLMCAKASIPSSIYAAGDKMTSVAGTWAKTNETRAEYRTMAAERGTGFRQLDYYLHSAIQLLYLVEYADFNSQTMIGAGRTNLSGGGWTADSYIALTGLSTSDGNSTNSVALGGTNYLTDYMTYRGIENLYGNVWKMVDGIAWDGTWTGAAAAQPIYVTNNSSYFADQVSTNMKHLCDAPYIGTLAGYTSNIENVIGFIPSAVGASSTTDICDYYYQYSELSRDYWRVVLVGSYATDGGLAGVFSLDATYAWSYAAAAFGGRLCY